MPEKSTFNSIREHLVTIGFTEAIDEGVHTFEHPDKVWVAASEENGGVMLTTAFKGAEEYNPNDPTLLSILNTLNQEALASTFVALDEYTVCRAWYYGAYSQQNFQNFYELFEGDIDLFLSGMDDDESEE